MLDFDAINKQIEDGYISVQHHTTADYRILNYTQKAQYDWHWTPETMACRGLIVDSKNEVIQRPFPKFFSYEQLGESVPDEPFVAYEKMDGSLGILYWVGDTPMVATRGSFTSDQSVRATRILADKYLDAEWDRSKTYLFEIVYPENRIVVDYGDTEDLFLLAVIDTATGMDCSIPSFIPSVKQYDISSLNDVLSDQSANREGYVLRFESGTRVKFKFEEYKRLHKILTGVNKKNVWESLATTGSTDSMIKNTPDEFHQWVNSVEKELRDRFRAIERKAKSQFAGSFPTRKEAAEYYMKTKYPQLMFAMLDGRDCSQIIWKMIRPSGSEKFMKEFE